MEGQRKGLVPISPSQTPRSMEKGVREVRESGSNSSRHDKDKGVNVQVLLRCRPLNEDELKMGTPVAVSCNEVRREVSTVQTISNKQIDRTFIFDKVFGPNSEQKDLYEQAVSPIVNEVLEGYNCTIFAYGQTGTGKTYTMEGGARKKNGEFPSDAGVIPRAVKEIFEILEAQSAEYNMKVTFLELYNEEITDLLASEECYKVVEEKSKKPIALMEDGKGGVFVRGLEEEIVCTANEIYKILEKGSARRRTAETLLNKQSSRSHSIFSITIHIKESTPEGEEMIKCGKLNLVDLAGSENISRSGAREGRAREAGEINKSLLTLGRVINTLVEHSGHIPYRDSKLTRLLRDSLGGKTKTCIIATIAPSISSLEETLSTLDYAHRAKNIKNKPEINQKMMKSTMIKELYSEIDKLKQEVNAAREKNGIYIPKDRFLQEEIEKKAMSDRLEHMELELESKDKRLAELQSVHHSQQFLVNELNDKLGRTEIKLEETQQMVSDLDERLLHSNSTIKEKEYLISNLLKSEKSLMEQAFVLRAELENAASDMSKLFTKIDRKDKIEDGNKNLIREFESQLHQQLEALNKMVTGSMIEQERRLKEMEEDMHSFVSTKTEAAEDLRTFVGKWKDLYASGVNDLDDIVEEIEKNSRTVFEDMNLEFSRHSSSADNLLEGITSAADSLLGDLQSNLHDQEEKLHAFSLQQNDVHSRELETARSISKTAVTFFNSLHNQTSRLTQIVEEVQVMHNNKLSELEHKFEECTAREEKQLLEKVAELVAGSNSRTKTLIQESIQALRNSMESRSSDLQSEVASIEDRTSSMRMEWTGYMENTEKHNIKEVASLKKREEEMEEGLENCLKKAKLGAQQWRNAQESLMDLERKNISSVDSISRRGLEANQSLYSQYSSSTSSTMENVENVRKGILSRIDESVRHDNDMCSSSTETGTKPCWRESQKVRSGHYHGISLIKENAGKCLVGEYRVDEPTCLTPRKRLIDLPSRAAIEGLATPAFEDLINHFHHIKQQQPSSINGDVTTKPPPRQSLKDPRLPLTTIN